MFAGLDIGTTGCKLTVYNKNEEYLGRVYEDYPAMRSAEEHELDPGAVWMAVQKVLTAAAAKFKGIEGIGITSFGESFVLLDKDDKPLCNVMLYTDSRGEAECEALCQRLGRERLSQITGLNPHAMYSLPKLMWIMDNQPGIYERAKRVCLMEDYIAFMLTGEAVIDYSLASRTMSFDIRSLNWSKEVFSASGVDSGLFSRPVPTGTSIGRIKKNLSTSLGFKQDVIVVVSGHDQVAAAVGSGVFDTDVAVDGAGTVECVTPVFEGIPEGDALIQGYYAIVPYIEPGKYVCYAFSYTGGALVQWFADNLAGYAHASAKGKNISVFEELDGAKLPTGLLVLPHFAGAATPYMDYGSKGAIIGLTISHTQQDIFAGIMEGVCYEMALNVKRLNKAGIGFDKLRATGGGANNKTWMQMKANVLKMPVTALNSVEAGAAGSAMIEVVNPDGQQLPAATLTKFEQDLGLTSGPVVLEELGVRLEGLGLLQGLANLDDARRLLGDLPAPAVDTLEQGGVILIGALTKRQATMGAKPFDGVSEPSGTSVDLPVLPISVDAAHRWTTGAGFVLTDALPGTLTQTGRPVIRVYHIYQGLTPDQDAQARRWSTDTGLNSFQIQAYRPSTGFSPPVWVAISLFGFGLLFTPLLALVLRNDVNALTGLAATLRAIGLGRSWIRPVFAILTGAVVTIAATTALVAALASVLILDAVNPGIFNLSGTPWWMLALFLASILVSTLLATLSATRGLTRKEHVVCV